MSKKKNIIEICMGSSCFSRGNSHNLEILKTFVKEQDLDIQIELKGHLCSDLCNRGPIIKINNKIYEKVSESNLTTILKSIFSE